MQTRNTPVLGLRYWTLLCLASVAGCNLGDFCSRVLGLGHDRGLPFLALAFGAILFGESRSRAPGGTDAWYWAAILALRTAATNLGDLATHDFKLAYPAVIAALALTLAIAGRAAPARSDDELPPTGWIYWAAMLCAATLGTALGDYAADETSLLIASAAFCVILAALLAGRAREAVAGAASYWAAVVIVRCAGTTVGDFLVSRREGLGLGLPLGTALTVGALAAAVLSWRREAGGPAVAAGPARSR